MAAQKSEYRRRFSFDGIYLPAGIVITLLSLPALIAVVIDLHQTPGWLDIFLMAFSGPGCLVGGIFTLRGIKEYRLSRWAQY